MVTMNHKYRKSQSQVPDRYVSDPMTRSALKGGTQRVKMFLAFSITV